MKRMSVFAAAAAVVTLSAGAALAADAPVAFNACKACHKVEAGGKGIGPTLFGVVGRKAGSVEGFAGYSDGVKALGYAWDDAKLTAWITNPKAVVPGTKMAFAGVTDSAKVKDIVEYLKTLK